MSETEATIDLTTEKNEITDLDSELLDSTRDLHTQTEKVTHAQEDETQTKPEQELDGEKFIPDITQRFADKEIQITYKTDSGIDAVGKIQNGEIWYRNPLTMEYESGLEAAGENFLQQYEQQKLELLETGKSIFQFEIEGKINFIVQELADGKVNSYHYEVTPMELDEFGKEAKESDELSDFIILDNENLNSTPTEVIEVTEDDIFGNLILPSLIETVQQSRGETEPTDKIIAVPFSNSLLQPALAVKKFQAPSTKPQNNFRLDIAPPNKSNERVENYLPQTELSTKIVTPAEHNEIRKNISGTLQERQSAQTEGVEAIHTDATPRQGFVMARQRDQTERPIGIFRKDTAPAPTFITDTKEKSSVIENADKFLAADESGQDETLSAQGALATPNREPSTFGEHKDEEANLDEIEKHGAGANTFQRTDELTPSVLQTGTLSEQGQKVDTQVGLPALEAEPGLVSATETKPILEQGIAPVGPVDASQPFIVAPEKTPSIIDELNAAEQADVAPVQVKMASGQISEIPSVVQYQSESATLAKTERAQAAGSVADKAETAPQATQQIPETLGAVLPTRSETAIRPEAQPTPIKLDQAKPQINNQLAALGKLLENRQSPVQSSQPYLGAHPARRISVQEFDRSRLGVQKTPARTEAAASIIKAPSRSLETVPQLVPQTLSGANKKQGMQIVTEILRSFTTGHQSVIRPTETKGKVVSIEQFRPLPKSSALVNADDDKINNSNNKSLTARAA